MRTRETVANKIFDICTKVPIPVNNASQQPVYRMMQDLSDSTFPMHSAVRDLGDTMAFSSMLYVPF